MGQKAKNEVDFRCAYYKKDNTWTVLWGDEFNNGIGTESFKECLLSLINSCKNEQIKIFVNDVRTIGEVFKGKLFGEHRRGEHQKKVECIGKTLTTTKNGNITRLFNLNVFINDNMKHYFEEHECPALMMREYLEHINTNPFAIKYSLGYMSKRKFYAPIRETLTEDIINSNRNIMTGDMYNHLKTGNRSGFLVNSKEDADYIRSLGFDPIGITIDNKIITNGIDEYDLNSAYISTMISDWTFPVGQVYELDSKNEHIIEKFDKLTDSAKWFKIYIPENVSVDVRIAMLCGDTRNEGYGIEYYDYKALTEFCGMKKEDFHELLKEDGVCLYWCYAGRLHEAVRKRVAEYYDNKKNPEIKGTIYGDLAKQENELIYGKSLQDLDFDFSEIKVVMGKLSDGINYMLPHMALHCTAAVRYRLMQACFENMETVTYYDTDSIHGTDLEEYIEIDNSVNDFKNAIAGFKGCTAGRWKTEQKNSTEIIFAPKQRICLQDGEWTVRVCGIGRLHVEDHIRKLKDLGYSDKMVLNYFYMNGFDEVIVPVYIFDPESGYNRIEMDYGTFKKTYGKDELDGT